MKFYHATTAENMEKILEDGKIKHSFGGDVFLCRNPLDACKFLVIRGYRQVSVIQVHLKKNEVTESNDHSERFFQCKAYTYHGHIELDGTEDVREYEFDI